MDDIDGWMEDYVHEVCRLLERKARMFLRVRGLVLRVQVMQPDELGKADIAALAAMFHKMLEKVTHLDQFSREIPRTDHLEGEQENE